MRGKIEGFVKQTGFVDAARYCFAGLLAFQCLAIIYVNLFQNQNHLGYDASALYLKAIEMWRQGTPIPDYYDETFLCIDAPVPIAALFYGLTGNIFISYGLANIIITSLIAALAISLWRDLLKEFGSVEILALVIPLNILFSPFIVSSHAYDTWNPIRDPYGAMYVSSAYFSVKILTGLLCLKAFAILVKQENKPAKPRHKALLAATLALLFVGGLSSGLYATVTFLLPLFALLCLRALLRSDPQLFFNRALLFIASGACLAFIGRLITINILKLPINDAKELVGSADFFKNLGSIYLGFAELMAGMGAGSGTVLFSSLGIQYLINFAICNFLLFAPLVFIVSLKKRGQLAADSGLMMYIFIIAVNLAIFSLCYLTYGSGTFENRYLLPVYFCLLTVLGLFVSAVAENKEFWLLRNVALAVIFIFLLFSNVASQQAYAAFVITDYNKLMPQLISKYGADLVYGTELDLTRNMRVLDTSRVYQEIVIEDGREDGLLKIDFHHYGGYTYYEEPGSYQGPTILLASPREYDKLPYHVRELFVFQEVTGVRNLNIYLSEINPLNP
jgi:hypothetical protein